MSVELFLTIMGAAGLVVGGFWAVASVAGKQFEKRLDERFKGFSEAIAELRRVGLERIEKLESKYETLDRELRRILIEMPREYVARTDYVRRETVLEGKIDQLTLRCQQWFEGERK